MSSKRFAGEVIWGSCALGFNETCFGFCVFALQEGILHDVFSQKCSGALEEKGLQLVSCCQAVKMRMTGSTSCCRRRTDGLQLGVLSQRRSQNRSSAKSGTGCRPSICGWWSSYGGGVLVDRMYVQAPTKKSNEDSMLCSLTGPPDATAQTHMKRKSIVVLESKKSKHGGRNVKIGWHTLKNKVNRLSMTSRSC